MDFTMTLEQEAFGSSLRKACGDRLTGIRTLNIADRHQHIHSLMGSLDLFGLTTGNEFEGAGSAVDTMVASEELGRWNANNEFVESVVLCGELLKQSASNDQCLRWLRPLAEGRLTFSMPMSPHDQPGYPNSARFTRCGRGYRLDAHGLLTPEFEFCDVFLIPAVASDSDVVHIFGVSRTQAGVHCSRFEALDGAPWMHLDLEEVFVDEADVIKLGDRPKTLDRALDAARASLCAESLGASEALFSLCCDYLITRKQFNQSLSFNQILRHRIADMRISLELMRSMACIAAMAVSEASAERRSYLVSSAKKFIDGRAQVIAQEAIQMHGAMGMSDECVVGDYVRRILFVRRRLEGEQALLSNIGLELDDRLDKAE